VTVTADMISCGSISARELGERIRECDRISRARPDFGCSPCTKVEHGDVDVHVLRRMLPSEKVRLPEHLRRIAEAK
jgi:hypothetical protein